MRENREQVIQLLESYRTLKKKAAVLRYELEHRKQVSPSELVVAMTFAHGAGDGQRQAGHVSDPTLRVAMNYQETARRLNSEAAESILRDLAPLEDAVDRMEYYASLLQGLQNQVIKLHYFDGLSLSQISEQTRSSPKTVRKAKNDAIDELAEMYQCSGSAVQSNPQTFPNFSP